MAVCLVCDQGVGRVQELGIRYDLQRQSVSGSALLVPGPTAHPKTGVKAALLSPFLQREGPHTDKEGAMAAQVTEEG